MADKKISRYDVFLNHRGPDTKKQFLVPLVEKLHEAGIERSFLDSLNIHFGEMVSTVIEEALQSARMHIAFFSTNYARSAYCLIELQQMLLTGSPIITVFYDVAPEDLRRPRNIPGPYTEAFRIHAERQKPEVVESWVKALEQAAAFRGFVRASYGNNDELLAKDIVKEVVKILRPTTVTIPARWERYDWRSHYKLPTKGQGIIFFAADTNKNLHITFSPEAGNVFPSYEIVIGYRPTWQYTRSEIRRCIPQEKMLCSYYPKDLTNPHEEGELQHFWICLDAETKLIYVGQGKDLEEEAAFIIFKDPAFLENILYFAFSTGPGAITYTDITVERSRPALLGNYGQDSSSALWSSIDASQVLPSSPDVKFSKSADNYGDYNWSKAYKLPTKGRGIVCFSVKAIAKVRVAISPKPQTMDPMYEIVVCGSSESGIKRKGQKDMLCCVSTFGLIQLGSVNDFWVSINTDTQLIHVGAGNQPNLASVVCVYKDPYFISEARYVSFLSGDKDTVYSSIFVASPSASRLLSPEPLELLPCSGQYDWIPSYQLLSEGQGILYFAANATTDIHVAISSQCQTMDPMYEIVIGGWGNTKSGIRRRAQGQLLCYVDKGFDDTENLNHFWVSIDKHTQLILVGQGRLVDLDSVIFMYKDQGFLYEAKYVAFSSWDTPITYSSVSVSFQSATITTPIEDLSQKPIFCANILLQHPNFKMVIPGHLWGRYRWQKYFELPCKGKGVVYFAAETFTDVHVAISPLPATVNPMYEIVIGGWHNSMSVIRRASQGNNLCSSTFGPPIVPGLNRYWVSINALTRFIKVGLGEHPEVESSILLTYEDSNFINDARYVAFTSWNAPVTYSNISLGTI